MSIHLSGKGPAKRAEEPDDLVGTCQFLASPESDFMSGQTIVVDGGSTIQ